MQSACRFAFKEWAVVCAALETGRQALILRKGGIHEGREGFRVEYRQFWLFPTNFHQSGDEITPDARDLLAAVQASSPPAGQIRLQQFAVVTDVLFVDAPTLLPRLAGLHIWSLATLEQRFHYRTPGLFALVVRIQRTAEPLMIADSPHFGGCRSWVELPHELPTSGLVPVLSDAEFDEARRRILAALRPPQVV